MLENEVVREDEVVRADEWCRRVNCTRVLMARLDKYREWTKPSIIQITRTEMAEQQVQMHEEAESKDSYLTSRQLLK